MENSWQLPLTKGPGRHTHTSSTVPAAAHLWQLANYSAISHAGFEGLLDIAPYLTRDSQTHEIRGKDGPRLSAAQFYAHGESGTPSARTHHRGAEASLQFDGADIGPRLHRMWHALMPIPEAKELYTVRYQSLMATKGIKPQ